MRGLDLTVILLIIVYIYCAYLRSRINYNVEYFYQLIKNKNREEK